jgi:shikimate dehydrogenase
MTGVNVTVPHKEKVMPLLDEIDEEASFIGAVNTIVNSGGKLIGHNADGRGFMQSLSENGIDTKDKDILIIGAGGAARSIGYYLCQDAGRLSVYGRSRERVEKLVDDLRRIRKSVSVLDDISDIGRFQIIINATPLGLKENDALPFDTELLKGEQVVCDLIYWTTPLLAEAEKKGCIAIDGLGMLMWQGVSAFELWTGKRPPVDVMRNALKGFIK